MLSSREHWWPPQLLANAVNLEPDAPLQDALPQA